MTSQYDRILSTVTNNIHQTPAIVAQLLAAENFNWAGKNYRMLADAHVDRGILLWRHGLDPRSDFARAADAYDALTLLVRERNLDPINYTTSLIHAAMFLIGRQEKVVFVDEDAFAEFRWPCYHSCLVHLLNDQPLTQSLSNLLMRHLAQNDDLPDITASTYLRLLGWLPSDLPQDRLVASAEENWNKRRSHKLFASSAPLEGYGEMNDLYLDIYLSSVLKKIGWTGQSVHSWHW